ncbi:hypothetical protein ONZ51_g6939 [Trametes cubensis]|uniref:Uncharacterized protein n=1 Tax=Trametes cubensis TaxID=1111947 RepID=A0AAD7XA23_9APHY|nr:hypothetical protein ONZ51_g6939 [Trametes cubensis]
MSSHTVVYDDSDTTSIKYVNIWLGPYRGRGWSTKTGPSLDDKNEGPIYNSTLHVATVEDTSVQFPFKGTRVAVYGSIWPPTATYAPLTLSAYSVLGWDYEDKPAMIPFQAPNLTSPKNDVNFFTSDEMPFGEYVLTINITRASEDSPYYLDYITVDVPGLGLSSSSTTSSAMQESATSYASPNPGNGPSPVSSSSTSGGGHSPVPLSASSTSPVFSHGSSTDQSGTASLSQSTSGPSPGAPSISSSAGTAGSTALPPLASFSHKSSVPLGALIGAIIGGLLLIATLIFLISRVHLRRQRPSSEYNDYGTAGRCDRLPSTPSYRPDSGYDGSSSMREFGLGYAVYAPTSPTPSGDAQGSYSAPSPTPSSTPTTQTRVLPSRKALAEASFRPLSDAVYSTMSGSSGATGSGVHVDGKHAGTLSSQAGSVRQSGSAGEDPAIGGSPRPSIQHVRAATASPLGSMMDVTTLDSVVLPREEEHVDEESPPAYTPA